MLKVGDEVVLPLIIEKICNEELVGAKSEADVTYLFKIEEANRVLKPKDSKTYTQGLADAWELAKRLYEMSGNERFDVVGYGDYANIMEFVDVEEALAKIEAYDREKEIKVGDVVSIWDGTKAVVIDDIGEGEFYTLSENGCMEKLKVGQFKKTDKYIELAPLLRQIGE